MDGDLFETNADIDVEGLMSRISESAKRRAASFPDALRPEVPAQTALNALQTRRLNQEIQNGVLSAEMINQIPLKRHGTRGRIEIRLKKLLKWLVHWNTKGQADFNHSVIRSLRLIAQDLETGQYNFATLEQSLRADRELTAQARREASQQTHDICAQLEESGANSNSVAVRLSDLEKRTSQGLEEIKQRIQEESLVIEEKLREREERSTQSNKELGIQINGLSSILEGLNCKTEAVAAHSSELERKMKQLPEEIPQNVRRNVEALVAEFREELNRNALETQQLTEHVSGLSAMLENIGRKSEVTLDEFRMRILRGERIARSASRGANAAEQGNPSKSISKPQAYATDHRTNGRGKAAVELPSSKDTFSEHFDYFLFESRFRGPLSEIKRRQSTYLELFREKKNVVDLGCGRGEFVELLSENGITVTGVDRSADMVDFCRDRRLSVVQADIFEYLATLPDGSLDGVFISQVVEHLPPQQILKLVSLCAEKMELGGVIVAETVNTNCSTALSNFYLDPTHVRPVPPEMLRFILEQASFQVQNFRFSSPLPGNNVSEVVDLPSGSGQEVLVYQDYAVVAVKASEHVRA